MDGIGPDHAERDQRMTAFVVGGQLLFFVGHRERAAFRAHHDLVFGVFELGPADQTLPASRGQQCRFVDEVRKVRARETRRSTGLWDHIASAVTSSLSEPQMERQSFERSDGAIVSLSLTRLPNAAILARFADVAPSRMRAREAPAEPAKTPIVPRFVPQGARSRFGRH